MEMMYIITIVTPGNLPDKAIVFSGGSIYTFLIKDGLEEDIFKLARLNNESLYVDVSGVGNDLFNRLRKLDDIAVFELKEGNFR